MNIIQHTRRDSSLEAKIALTATGNTDALDLLQAGGIEDVHIQVEPTGMSTGNTATVKLQGAMEETPDTWADIETISLTDASVAKVMRPVIDPAYRYVRLAVTTASKGSDNSAGTGDIAIRILV